MIFVSVGTNEARFDRLLEAVEGLAPEEELVVQHGPSPVRPTGATCVDYLSFEEMTDHLARARVSVLHAGVGSILTALASGARPVVVPRLQRYGEAVDDHQVGFGRRVHAEGLVFLVEDLGRLSAVVAAHETRFEGGVGVEGRLVEELRDLIAAELGR
jgi:UDP-N-acetylglucosamine transferase subunit ALG13